MPSASAKLEKQVSTDASDPVKQVLTIVEKRVRNLEKRKAKLDSYKHDSQNGKELNDDQKKAVEKYDQVVEILEFAKEMQKSFNTIIQDTLKMQKKAAKREQLERQQQELQRIKDIMMFQDILNSMDGEDVRSEFLNGTNGAVKLTEEELNSLDELYKLVCPERSPEPEENADFDKQLSAAAEHVQSLLDSKQKEIVGTSYKALKDIISKIHSCGYFNKSGNDDDTDLCNAKEYETDDLEAVGDVHDDNTENVFVEEQFPMHHAGDMRAHSFVEDPMLAQQSGLPSAPVDRSYYQAENSTIYQEPSHPIPEVLAVQGNLNFLQESQIDLESPHMDPAVVVAHPVIPGNIGYSNAFVSGAQSTPSQGIPSQHHAQRPKEESTLTGHMTPTRMLPNTIVSTTVQQQSSVPNNSASAQNLQAPNPSNPPADFDPNRPIPTQTYTNQSFTTVVHPMMAAAGVAVPQSYVPVTLAHAIPPQHILPANLVAQTVQPRGTVASPTAVSDPNALSMSAHTQPSGLPVTSSMSKGSISSHEAKEHYSREFQMPQQMSLERDSPQTVQSSGSSTSQFEHVEAQEGHFDEEFGNGRTARGGSRGNRGAGNMYSRGAGQAGFGNDRGYQSTNNSQAYINRENFTTEGSSYSSNLKRGLSSRGAARGNSGPRGTATGARGSRGGYRNQ